jgi:adenylate cyclase class 2
VARVHSAREIEVKLRVPSAAEARRMLERAGFRRRRARVHETNCIYDTAGLKLRRADTVLRLRKAGSNSILTYKGPAARGRYKSREELELEIGSPEIMAEILKRLGFEQVFCYEKFRTEYSRPGKSGIAMLDETPIGCFVELEGAPDWIDSAAEDLGFSPADYIVKSYGALYRDFCDANQGVPGDMVFRASAPGRRRAARRSGGLALR